MPIGETEKNTSFAGMLAIEVSVIGCDRCSLAICDRDIAVQGVSEVCVIFLYMHSLPQLPSSERNRLRLFEAQNPGMHR